MELGIDLAPNNPRHLKLKNPVMIASGTFGFDGYGSGIPPEMPLDQLGAVVPKTVTRYRRQGNPEPRWHPTSYRRASTDGEAIFLNSIGLANPGIDTALNDLAPKWVGLGTTVIFSLAADSVDQFSQMTAMTRDVDGFQALELNLSCPNVKNGALFAHSPDLTAEAVTAVKDNTDLPVVAKLAPNVPDITKVVCAAAKAGVDAITIGNTMPALRIDVASRTPVLGAITGGLSGHGLRPVNLALVYRAAQAVDVPIIGVGGIFTADHALEYFLAGATAVQIGSANLVEFQTPLRVLEKLQAYMEKEGVNDIGDLTGAVRRSLPDETQRTFG